ncbi:MAG: hypothetical protein ACOX7K_07685 [Oscillospiraceae bacterium]|jgi:hypothetical protein
MPKDIKFHSSFQSYSSIRIRNAVLAEILTEYPAFEFEIYDDVCTFSEESSACRYAVVPRSLEEITEAICNGCGDVDDDVLQRFREDCETREEELLDAYELVDWHFSDCGWDGDRKEPLPTYRYDEDTLASFRGDVSALDDVDYDEVDENRLRDYIAECSSDYQTHFVYEDGKLSYDHIYERT